MAPLANGPRRRHPQCRQRVRLGGVQKPLGATRGGDRRALPGAEPKPINWIKAEARYINGIPFDPKQEPPMAFLKEKLHLKVEVPGDFLGESEALASPAGVAINLAFPLQSPVGHLVLTTSLGEAHFEKPAYIVQLRLPLDGSRRRRKTKRASTDGSPRRTTRSRLLSSPFAKER